MAADADSPMSGPRLTGNHAAQCRLYEEMYRQDSAAREASIRAMARIAAERIDETTFPVPGDRTILYAQDQLPQPETLSFRTIRVDLSRSLRGPERILIAEHIIREQMQ